MTTYSRGIEVTQRDNDIVVEDEYAEIRVGLRVFSDLAPLIYPCVVCGKLLSDKTGTVLYFYDKKTSVGSSWFTCGGDCHKTLTKRIDELGIHIAYRNTVKDVIVRLVDAL